MEAQKETQDGDDDDDDDDNKNKGSSKIFLTLKNVGSVEDGGHRTLACLRSWLTPDHTN